MRKMGCSHTAPCSRFFMADQLVSKMLPSSRWSARQLLLHSPNTTLPYFLLCSTKTMLCHPVSSPALLFCRCGALRPWWTAFWSTPAACKLT